MGAPRSSFNFDWNGRLFRPAPMNGDPQSSVQQSMRPVLLNNYWIYRKASNLVHAALDILLD